MEALGDEWKRRTFVFLYNIVIPCPGYSSSHDQSKYHESISAPPPQKKHQHFVDVILNFQVLNLNPQSEYHCLKVTQMGRPLTHHNLGPRMERCGGRSPHTGPLHTASARPRFWWSSVVLYHSELSMDAIGTSWTTHSPLEGQKKGCVKTTQFYAKMQISHSLLFHPLHSAFA